MPRVALHTLGCKVNQYETEKIIEDFRSKGFEVVDFKDHADVYVINSCTVTGVADSKSRQAARAAYNRNPNALVVFTGCYAEKAGDSLNGVSMLVANREKGTIADRVAQEIGSSSSTVSSSEGAGLKGRTRALLKIQDGCDQFCAYCAVPFARSEMWSKAYDEVIAEAESLANAGYKEIVLTGIRVGRYSDSGNDLTGVLQGLAGVSGIERIRLSSIESTDIPDGMIELMAENPKICRHLHIPLQSGDDEVLTRMNRPYTTVDFRDLVSRARTLVPDLAVTTDIMVGFPGESGAQFENTLKFAKEIAFSRAHVFRYSSRPGTVASEMTEVVSAEEKERRSGLLIGVTTADSDEFAQRLIGKLMPVLVESKEITVGKRSGLTDNYVRTVFVAGPSLVGKIVNARIEDVTQGTAYGSVEA